MKQTLLNLFESYRDNIIDLIYEYVKNEKEVILSKNSNSIILYDTYIYTYVYKKLFLQEDILVVNYEYGEGFEPYQYESATEDLRFLSANELYEILLRIKN